MTEELKPCPFCDGKPEVTERVGGWTIDCIDPKGDPKLKWPCRQMENEMFETEAEAVAVWNHRPIEEALRARAEKAENALFELAKESLLSLMEYLSEAKYCCGWYDGLDQVCAEMIKTGKDNYYPANLRKLHDLCGGWWVWNDEKAEPIFKFDAEIEVTQ